MNVSRCDHVLGDHGERCSLSRGHIGEHSLFAPMTSSSPDIESRPAGAFETHGHLDPEANPSYESNVTIHGHVNGGKPHRHPDAPSWSGAYGTEYVTPMRAAYILEQDRCHDD